VAQAAGLIFRRSSTQGSCSTTEISASPQLRDHVSDTSHDHRTILVLPEPQHGPASRLQRFRVEIIARTIARDLWSPIVAVADVGSAAVLRAPVPEAAVAEDRDASAREHDVRADRPHALQPDRQIDAEPQAGKVQT
jgi:hypothetical protein